MTKRQLAKALSTVLALTMGVVANAQVTDISFHQASFYETDGTPIQVNSVWGRMSVEYVPTGPQMFLNVSLSNTAHNSNAVWAVQNMPLITSSLDPFDPILQEGVDIDLSDLGVPSGTSWSGAFYDVSLTTGTLSSGNAVGSSFASADSFNYKTSDSPDESVFAGPGDPGIPKGMKDNPAPFADALQDFIYRRMDSVQEGTNQCFAGACARSLGWLDRTNGYNFPASAQDIFNDLIGQGVSVPNPGGGIARNRWVKDKAAYARSKSGNDISTEIWDSDDYIDPAKIGTATREGGDFMDWFDAQMKKKQDIELIYNYPGSAHAVTIVGTYVEGGKRYVLYRDDEEQNDPNKGDGVGGKKYPANKRMQVYKSGGKYYFGSDRNTITWAVAESPGAVPEPATFLAVGLGLALVVRRRKVRTARS